MAELLKKITELLNEEKWTRATLNSYTINNFKELDELIQSSIKEKTSNEVKEICDEHLTHTKNSIIALYISGILSLRRQMIDDANMVTLIDIFSDNHKWKIVEFLCNRILSFGENKYALRTLSECYENENEIDKKFEIWERLIKVDYEEADIVKQLAERCEEQEEIEKAVEFFKKAIHRFVNKKQFANVKEIWHKLLEYIPEDTDFFFHVEKKIANQISEDRAAQLLEDLYAYFNENEEWDKAIAILKSILEYDPKNGWARKEITDCFREKYNFHSQLDEYIRVSNLNQSWRNVFDAIADFEKHISFDAGNFVFHRSWGVGRISSIEDDEIVIDFARKRNHRMSLKMAVNALSSLASDHIWVLRCIQDKKTLHDKIKGDIPWALSTVIKSLDNAANMKQIKAELVPGILTQGEWSSWSSQARQILKTDSSFGNLPDKVDQFVVREKPISFEEKTFNRFKAEKSFFNRIATFREFLDSSDPESEFFGEMYNYFTGFLKAFNTVNEQVISSYLLLQVIIKQYPFLNPGFDHDFSSLIEQVSEIGEVFSKIDDSELKRQFLENVQEMEDWPDIFVQLFPHYLSSYIIEQLSENGHEEKCRELFSLILDRYREYREAFVWLAKNALTEEHFETYEISYEKILIGMIHLLDITFREIENRRDVSTNRKINKQIQNYLFKDGRLEEYILGADEESIGRLYTLVEDVSDLDPSIRIELKHKIVEKYPDFKFYGDSTTESVSRGLIVTAGSYQAKQKQLQHIIEVEIPENSREIGAAIEMGDLRENAEYKAGKEKQELLNLTAARLKEDLKRAQLFDPRQVDTSKISFGTKAMLENTQNSDTEEYTFLGPWESDPSKRVISYLSPFGSEFWNHTEGEELKFTINEKEYSYKILKIEKASI